MRLPASQGRGPLAIAAFIAIPLFFSSLMASTLAQEKPRVIQWMRGGHVITRYFDPSAASFAALATTNFRRLRAGILMASPVWGFRPVRAL